MNHVVLMAFIDELTKVASNVAALPQNKSGMGGNIMVSSIPRVGIPKLTKDPSAKPTNYSIVHSTAPMAAQGTAAAASKAVPPPPVRT